MWFCRLAQDRGVPDSCGSLIHVDQGERLRILPGPDPAREDLTKRSPELQVSGATPMPMRVTVSGLMQPILPHRSPHLHVVGQETVKHRLMLA